ncbi:MAG: hypothetical protein Q7V58_09470 [Actinomycetota bacterium]|nr:hypothetical protein [Actinomycetota bacterium]
MGREKVTVRLHRARVRELLKSPEVLADLTRRAEAIAAAAGEGCEVDSAVGRTRARASVRTATPEAVRAEARDKILTRAIGAGR